MFKAYEFCEVVGFEKMNFANPIIANTSEEEEACEPQLANNHTLWSGIPFIFKSKSEVVLEDNGALIAPTEFDRLRESEAFTKRQEDIRAMRTENEKRRYARLYPTEEEISWSMSNQE